MYPTFSGIKLEIFQNPRLGKFKTRGVSKLCLLVSEKTHLFRAKSKSYEIEAFLVPKPIIGPKLWVSLRAKHMNWNNSYELNRVPWPAHGSSKHRKKGWSSTSREERCLKISKYGYMLVVIRIWVWFCKSDCHLHFLRLIHKLFLNGHSQQRFVLGLLAKCDPAVKRQLPYNLAFSQATNHFSSSWCWMHTRDDVAEKWHSI